MNFQTKLKQIWHEVIKKNSNKQEKLNLMTFLNKFKKKVYTYI